MLQPILRRRLAAAAAAVLLLGACGEDGGDAPPAAVRRDTANPDWEDGLSAQQIEAKARALSPEEAAAQGLTVDTTIHLEVPQEEGDSAFLLLRDQPPPPPPLLDPAAADTADTVDVRRP